MPEIPDWGLSEDASRIIRTYKVGDFMAALAFINTIGSLAEDQWHHPDISFVWGYVTVTLRTKKIKGLHENDFIMATKIDQAFSSRI
jgi:4a-hydroxytetrahydrobiopterin dehydratase